MTQEQYEEYFKFAIVRNPWDRLVSFYKYLGYKNQMDFKTFVTEEFKNKVFKERYWFVGPQYEYVVDKNGKMIVDFIGKFESLQEDFDRACPLMALPATNVPHVNKSSERNKKPQSTFGALKETFKTGTGETVLGPHRRARIVFLSELWESSQTAGTQVETASRRRAKSI